MNNMNTSIPPPPPSAEEVAEPSTLNRSSIEHQVASQNNDPTTNNEPSSSLAHDHLDGFPADFPHHHRSISEHMAKRSASPDGNRDHQAGLMDASNPKLMFRGSTVRSNSDRSLTDPPAGMNVDLVQSRPSPPPPHEEQPHQGSTGKNLSAPQKPELRKCWICYDDEDDDERNSQNPPASDPSTSNARINQKSNKNNRWIKACRCSLVAHESCLLTWITAYQLTHPTPPSVSSSLLTPVKCPQCSATYQIVQPDSPLLSLIHQFKRPYNAAMSWAALGCVILGVGVSTSSYGLWASRCFLGSARWNRWISNTRQGGGGGLNFIKFFQLSLVGPILILSRTRQLDSVLPFLPISFILSSLPQFGLDGGDHNQWTDSNLLTFEHIFPPEPGLTLCLIPWMRIGWGMIWGRVSKLILKREYMGMSYQYPFGMGPGLAQAQAGGGVGDLNAANQMLDDENPNRNRNGEQNQDAAENPQGLQPPAEAEEPAGGQAAAGGEVVLDYTSLRTIIRIGMEALIWPGAASLAGSLLLLLSRNRPWLRRLLGLRTGSASSIFHQPYKNHLDHYRSSSSSSSSSSSPSIFSSIKSSISHSIYKLTRMGMFGNWKESDDRSMRLNPILDSFKLIDLTSKQNREFDADDPVWWRNTIGGSLLVLFQDVLSLLEKILRLRKLKYRRVLEIDQHSI